MVVCEEAPPSLEEEVRLQVKVLAKARVLLQKWKRGDLDAADVIEMFVGITIKVPCLLERLRGQLESLRAEKESAVLALQAEKGALAEEAAILRDQNAALRKRNQAMHASMGQIVAANKRVAAAAAAAPAAPRVGAGQARREVQAQAGGAEVPRPGRAAAGLAAVEAAGPAPARPAGAPQEVSSAAEAQRFGTCGTTAPSPSRRIALPATDAASPAPEMSRLSAADFDGVTYFDLSASDIDMEEESDTTYTEAFGLMADDVAKAQCKDISEIADDEDEQAAACDLEDVYAFDTDKAIPFLTMQSSACHG